MGKKLLLSLLVLCLQVFSIQAAENKGKGFILGAGIGIALQSHWDTKEHVLFFTEVPRDDNVMGLSFDFKGGVSLSSLDHIVLELNGTRYRSDELQDLRAIQFFVGPAYHRYFNISDTKSMDVGGGIGFYGFDLAGHDAFDPGLGWIVTLGYSIVRNLELASSFAGGSTSQFEKTMRHRHVSVNLNFLLR